MKHTSIIPITAAVTILIIATAAGTYYIVSSQSSTQSTDQTTTTPTSNNTTQQATVNTAPVVEQPLDLETIMGNVKTQFTTVQDTKIYTEENDPNDNQLGKPGFYTAGAAFWDTRTKFSEEYSEEKGAWGVEAGGSIEVYATEQDAATRAAYLNQFAGNALLDPGALQQVGKVVVRASYKFTKSQQDEIIAFLAEQVK